MDALNLTDAEIILYLQGRGYVVKHQQDASVTLSWHRMEPFPEGVVFEREAVEEITKQLTKEHIHFVTRHADGQTVRSARLRIIC